MFLCGGFVHADGPSRGHDGLWLCVGCWFNRLKRMDWESVEKLMGENERRLPI